MQAEPLWRLNRYDDLDELLKKHGLKDNNSWGVNIGRALLQIGTQSKFSETLKILRSQQIDSLAATSLEEGIYQHGYESIVKLHALNELEQIETIVRELLLKSNDHKAAEWIINKLSSEWDLRIKVSGAQHGVRLKLNTFFVGSTRIDENYGTYPLLT